MTANFCVLNWHNMWPILGMPSLVANSNVIVISVIIKSASSIHTEGFLSSAIDPFLCHQQGLILHLDFFSSHHSLPATEGTQRSPLTLECAGRLRLCSDSRDNFLLREPSDNSHWTQFPAPSPLNGKRSLTTGSQNEASSPHYLPKSATVRYELTVFPKICFFSLHLQGGAWSLACSGYSENFKLIDWLVD